MLVLTRKENEVIQIGDGIRVTVVRIQGGRVRIGIDAPNDVRIMRSEIAADRSDPTAAGETAEPDTASVTPKTPSTSDPVHLASAMTSLQTPRRKPRRNGIPRPLIHGVFADGAFEMPGDMGLNGADRDEPQHGVSA